MRVLELDELRAQDLGGPHKGPGAPRRRRHEQVVLEKVLERESVSVHLHADKERRELQSSCCVQDKGESARAGHSVAGRRAPES